MIIHNNLPIAAIIVGGGYTFIEDLKRPGASKIWDLLISPYSTKQIDKLLGEPQKKYCSFDTTEKYYVFLRKHYNYSEDVNYLIINASLATNRPKSGKYRAYIGYNGQYYYIEWHQNLFYENESEQSRYRERQDFELACIAKRIVAGDCITEINSDFYRLGIDVCRSH